MYLPSGDQMGLFISGIESETRSHVSLRINNPNVFRTGWTKGSGDAHPIGRRRGGIRVKAGLASVPPVLLPWSLTTSLSSWIPRLCGKREPRFAKRRTIRSDRRERIHAFRDRDGLTAKLCPDRIERLRQQRCFPQNDQVPGTAWRSRSNTPAGSPASVAWYLVLRVWHR